MLKLSRLFAGLAVAAFIGGIAEAHALLISSKVEGQDIVLRYNGRVDAARSRLTVINKDSGAEIQKVECEAGEDQATLKGHLGALAPGSYVLRWEVLSVDGHISRGDQPLVLPAP